MLTGCVKSRLWAYIVDFQIDNSPLFQALVDGPCTGVQRHARQFSQMHLTKWVLNMQHGARTRTVRKAWLASGVTEQFQQSPLCNKLEMQKIVRIRHFICIFIAFYVSYRSSVPSWPTTIDSSWWKPSSRWLTGLFGVCSLERSCNRYFQRNRIIHVEYVKLKRAHNKTAVVKKDKAVKKTTVKKWCNALCVFVGWLE